MAPVRIETSPWTKGCRVDKRDRPILADGSGVSRGHWHQPDDEAVLPLGHLVADGRGARHDRGVVASGTDEDESDDQNLPHGIPPRAWVGPAPSWCRAVSNATRRKPTSALLICPWPIQQPGFMRSRTGSSRHFAGGPGPRPAFDGGRVRTSPAPCKQCASPLSVLARDYPLTASLFGNPPALEK